MLEILRNAWKVVDLRKKIFFTLFITLIFRIGSVMPVPFVDLPSLRQVAASSGGFGEFFNYLDNLYGREAVRFRLEVEEENERAVKAYKKAGFEKLGYVQMAKDY